MSRQFSRQMHALHQVDTLICNISRIVLRCYHFFNSTNNNLHIQKKEKSKSLCLLNVDFFLGSKRARHTAKKVTKIGQ